MDAMRQNLWALLVNLQKSACSSLPTSVLSLSYLMTLIRVDYTTRDSQQCEVQARDNERGREEVGMFLPHSFSASELDFGQLSTLHFL